MRSSKTGMLLPKRTKKDGNADMIDVADLFEDDKDEKLLADDDFHPNQKGYSLMANRLFSEVKKKDCRRNRVKR